MEFVLVKIQRIHHSTKETAFEEVMPDVVDRHVHLQENIESAEETSQTEKKKDDKSSTANPAFKHGMQVKCQI